MAIKHSIDVQIIDEDDNHVRSNTYWEEDIERIGGVGSIIDTIEPLCRDREYIKIYPMYHK